MAPLRLLLLAAAARAEQSISTLSWYNSTAQIKAAFEALALQCGLELNPQYGGLVNWDGAGVQGVLFSNRSSPAVKQTVLINFGTHGRDYALADLALRLGHKLCDSSTRSSSIRSATDILLIPVLNVAGRVRVETALGSSTCGDLRKNRNQVDINANFAPDWVYGNSNPSGPDYRGPIDASEPETQLLISLLGSFKPDVFIDVQSGDSVTLAYPKWSSFDDPSSRDELLLFLSHVQKNTTGMCDIGHYEGSNECPRVGTASSATLPPAKRFGTALDWFYNHGVMHAFLFDTFSGSQLSNASTGTGLELESTRSSSSALVELATAQLAHARRTHDGTHDAVRVSRLGRQRAAGDRAEMRSVPQALSTSRGVQTSMVLTGELAHGALYDPIYDCIQYYAPISEQVFEAWVVRWLEAFLVTFEYVNAAVVRLACHRITRPQH